MYINPFAIRKFCSYRVPSVPLLSKPLNMSSTVQFSHRKATMGVATPFDSHSQQKQPSRQVVEIHSLDQWKSCLDASTRSNKLLVVDFTASWCGPCRFMGPALAELAAKFPDIEFVKIDVDRLPSVAKEFEVQTMPMVAMLRGARGVVDAVKGVKKAELRNKIEKHRTQVFSWN